MEKLWSGRFGERVAAVVDRLNASLYFDWRLAPYDLWQSRVWAEELHRIGILDDRPLPAIRIRPGREVYDYEAKYRDERTEYCFETGLDAGVLDRLADLSLRAFRHVGCRHLARVDWIVDAGGRPWFLEINTLPGFTSHSLLPKAAAKAGIDFVTLCDRLVRMALRDRD